MNGVHDLGGMHGFGPIAREVDEPLFHAAWEARVNALAMAMLSRGYYTKDAFRYGVERMEPAAYLRASYYERWLSALEYNLLRHGLLTDDELNARIELLRRHPDAELRQGAAEPPSPAQSDNPEPSEPPPAPRFAVGDAVVTRNAHPVGHTRLPRYARGKRGVIQIVHGPHTFPDTNAHELGEQPHALYSVRFEGRELWGDSTEPSAVVALDLWDRYLDPAPS